MPGILLAAAIVLGSDPALATGPSKPDTWAAAYKRGDLATAVMLLQRLVFEPPGGSRPDPAALKQLGLFYAEGKGVERDGVMACGLLRSHAIATARKGSSAAARRAAQAIVDKHCAPLSAADRAAAFAAMTCPRVGLQRGAVVALEPDWSIRFNDRSVTVTRNGDSREQPLAGDVLCRSQVLLVRHATIDGTTGGRMPASAGRTRGGRHVIELVTLHSGWRGKTVSREIVWQLYEVRGLALDLTAVERWEEAGSAWPAPPLPEPLARGVSFVVRDGQVEYAIGDDPPRRGAFSLQQAKR
jgi:hypothetical protein